MSLTKKVTNWVGSKNIPIRISEDKYSVVCKILSYGSEEEKGFASYIKNGVNNDFQLLSKTKNLEEAKFICNLELKKMGYKVSLTDF